MNHQTTGINVVNKAGCIMYSVLAAALIFANFFGYIKGNKSLALTLGLTAYLLVLAAVLWVSYLKDNYTEIVKHAIALGFGLYYTINCFTSEQRLVFVYAIPLLLLLGMYNDVRFSTIVSSICSLVAVIHSVWISSKHGWTEDDIEAMIIEAVIMILFAIYSIICSSITARVNNEKVEAINEAGEKTNNMLDEVMKISGEMTAQVNEISEKMEQIVSSSKETLEAMTEVQTGTTDTADSIQNQLYKTEEIQAQIDKVTGAAGSIGDNVVVTVDACHEGRDNMKILMEQTEVSEKAGNDVMNEVSELKDITAKMESIVELINNVASQTSLLALNASIEAARAGDAGRGFAVVASEISNLANQTQTATGNISALIDSISAKMNEVVSAINTLIENNKNQNTAATNTEESFQKIIQSIREIRTNSNELTEIVSTLASANGEIVEGIQTISAITEEVSAHSTTTVDSTRNNQSVVEEALSVVEEMLSNAEKLKAIQ
ncbi:MAG: hypothetical protein J5811_03875 [Lachnospiraceae bacterium]|nr:hypothetical protein [Lachnospiraceae bacterium]